MCVSTSSWAVAAAPAAWIDICGTLFFLLPACALLGWLTFGMFWKPMPVSEESTNAAGLLLWPALIMFPLGFALLALQAVSELIKRVAVAAR